MVTNDICLGGASMQNILFSENVPQKDAHMLPMSRKGPGNVVKKSSYFCV